MYIKLNKFKVSGIIFLMTISILLAGEVTIPNTFSANTKAKASEVNANFTALKNAINDNATDITTIETMVNDNISDLTTIRNRVAGVKTAELVEGAELTNDFLDQTSITINAPKDGYVHILATGTIQVLGKTNTTAVRVYVGVTGESNGTPILTYQTSFYRNATDGTGNYIVPYSVQGMFAVTAGTHTYYLV